MAYTIELYANNARTTLAGSANNTVTTLLLQSGAGALFPSPNNLIGEYAKATLQDAATGLRNEIVYITARTGDVLTVVRGQDGSTAQTWSAGDTVFEGVTAATLASFVQPSKVQSGQYTYTDATGTTTAYIAALTPALALLTDGMIISVDTGAVGTNTTTTPTVNANGLGAFTIVKQGGALRVGDMPKFARLQYDAALTQWVLLNPMLTGELIGVQIISTVGTSTYTPTVGTKSVIVEGVGGGGAGGGTNANGASAFCAGGGGGAGGYGKTRLTTGFSGVTVTVGAAGVPANNANGGAGGTTSFGSSMTLTGGAGGGVGLSTVNIGVCTTTNGTGGTSTGGNIFNTSGINGNPGVGFTTGSALSGFGGSSNFGSGGQSFDATAPGYAASGKGAGGGGACGRASAASQTGGAGSAGLIIVWEYN